MKKAILALSNLHQSDMGSNGALARPLVYGRAKRKAQLPPLTEQSTAVWVIGPKFGCKITPE